MDIWSIGPLCTQGEGEDKVKKKVEGYTLYDSTYVAFWKKHNYGDSERISGCQGLQDE